MNDHEPTSWTATIAWTLIAVVLFVFGMFLAEEMFAYLSFIAAGIAVASGTKAYRSRLQPSQPNDRVLEQVADLQARLEAAESEIERLRAESDFDRKLLRPREERDAP